MFYVGIKERGVITPPVTLATELLPGAFPRQSLLDRQGGKGPAAGAEDQGVMGGTLP